MDHIVPVAAKKLWNIVRVAFLMFRKGIAKRKLMLELNLKIKRRKIAGKSFKKVMSRHDHHHHLDDSHLSFASPQDYEFISCSNTPPSFPFQLTKRHTCHGPWAYVPPTPGENDLTTLNAVKNALEELHDMVKASPMVRKVRVTDSPFPLQDVEGDSQVDRAAEEFIMTFYKKLQQQNRMHENWY